MPGRTKKTFTKFWKISLSKLCDGQCLPWKKQTIDYVLRMP